MGLFTRRRAPTADTTGLGEDLIALRLDDGDVAPNATSVVIFNAAGHARRAVAGKIACGPGESVFCFHPGPYTVDLVPFSCAPEWGLRVSFVVDAANPRVERQRFDLYLFSETSGRLTVAGFAASMEAALQAELAQGALDLPPCTTLEEWHAFRAGLNQLLYTRYGITVDDCLPVDLGEQVDYADILQARAREAARARDMEVQVVDEVAPPLPASSSTPSHGQQDAHGLRRLFLELPALSADLRLLALPEGSSVFQQHQAILLRLGAASLSVNTMPALAWAAPDQPLDGGEQHRRSLNTSIAVSALDEAWSLLARLKAADAGQWLQLLEEADRVCANLETGLSLRRLPYADRQEPSL